MKTTLVTVTYPENAVELQACVRTMRAKQAEPVEWLIITEASNVAEIAALVPGEKVVSMDYDKRLEKIAIGYARQNAAKLTACKLVSEGVVVFVDDDVTAVEEWGPETFLEDGKPVVYFEKSSHYPWMFGQIAVFGWKCERLFQLRLPFAMSVETLREIAGNRWGNAAMERWLAGDVGVSEFCVMGEASIRQVAHGSPRREIYRNREVHSNHWTIDRGIFYDWQCDRRELRAAVAAGSV